MSEALPVVPDHELVRPIGVGGFGRVWLARNAIGTYRAVKIVSRNAVEDERDFDREFSGMKRFEPVSRTHEGLVDILHIGRAPDDSYFYYVMELGDDVEPRQEFAPAEYRPKTLAAVYRQRKRIPALEAALIGAQLADALSFLHRQGLIHRDIKPSNVLFVQGHARIGDPGLVAAIEAAHSLGGTVGFIAPEGPGTPKADIFALGKLLYVVSTGKAPSEFPVLPTDMTSFPDAADLRRLNLIILRACSHNATERYATAEELRKDLLEVHAGGSPGEIRQRLRLARRVGAALALALVVILGFYLRAQFQAKAERARLVRSYKDTAIRLQDNNDAIAALSYLGSIITTDPDDHRQNEAALRGVSFIWRHSPRLLQQYYFTNAINRVAFSADGNELALASASGSVWRWPWRSRLPAPLLPRHGSETSPKIAQSVAYSADGRWLASVGSDSKLYFWSLGNSNVPPGVVQLESYGHGIAFHPHDRRVAVACDNGSVVLVDLQDRVPPVLPLPAEDATGKALSAVAFSPDGSKLLAGSTDGWLYEVDLTQTRPILRRKLQWIFDVAFNHEGSLAAAASGHQARLNPFSDAVGFRLRHPAFVQSVSFDPTRPPGQDRLLTSCLDRTVRLWSCAEEILEEVTSPIYTDRQPSCAVFSPDGESFAIATLGGLVRVYQTPQTLGRAGQGSTWVAPNGSHYARSQDRTNLLVYDAISDRITREIHFPGSRISWVQLAPNGTRLLVGRNIDGATNGMSYEVWGADRSQPLAGMNMPLGVYGKWNRPGDCVAFRERDKFTLWQPSSATSFTWPWSIDDPFSDSDLSFSEASDRLVAAWSTNVLVLSTSNHAVIASNSFPHRIASADLDPTGDLVVAGEAPPDLEPSQSYVWSLPDWKQKSPALLHDDGIFLARFSPSGRWLIMTDEGGGCVVYDTREWKPVSLRQDFGIIAEVAFSSDERFVATVTENRGGRIPTIRVWELPSGDAATPVLRADASAFGHVSFLAGASAVIWYTGKQWHQWSLEKLDAPPKDLADLTQLLSCQRVTAAGVSVPLDARELDRLWRGLQATHPEWFRPAKP